MFNANIICFMLVIFMYIKCGRSNGDNMEYSGVQIVDALTDAYRTVTADSAYLKTISKILEDYGNDERLDNQTHTIGRQCLQQSQTVIDAFDQGEEWALHMLDAFGKPPSGLFNYKLLWLGDWDECLQTKAVIYNNNTLKTDPTYPFSGKYCSAQFQFSTHKRFGEASSLTVGMCFPSSCSSADVEQLLELMIDSLHGNTSIPQPRVSCQQNTLPLDGLAIAVITFCGLLILLMAVATVYDVVYVHWLAKTRPAARKAATNGIELVGSRKQDIYVVKSPSISANGNIAVNGSPPRPKPDFNITIQRQDSIGSTRTLRQDSVASERFVRLDSMARQTLRQDSVNTVDVMIRSELPEIKEKKGQPTLNTLEKVLLCFSILTNGTKLLSTHQPKGSLTVIHGVRFITMTWIVVGHAFTYLQGPETDNSRDYELDTINRFEFTPVFNAMMAVDTFFILSGLLVAYLSLKQLKKQKGIKHFNVALFYFHRYLRLTPPLMLLMLLWVSLDKYLADGPLWPQGGFQREACRKTWWTNLLFINNFVKDPNEETNTCFGWTWYLACDMQFYIISPLVFIPIFYWPVVGGIACIVLVLVGAISSGIISMNYELPTMATYDSTKTGVYMWEFYVKPWCRVGPYAIAMFTGYLLYRTQSKMNINKYINISLWFVSVILGGLVVYGLYSPDMKGPLTVTQSSVYNATARSVWAACVCWVIFSCSCGYGGPVTHVLSWPGFVPLSRLNYFVYLSHQILMSIYKFSQRTTITVYDYSVVYITIGHLCMSYAAAFVLSLAFEAPVAELEKVLLGREKRHDTGQIL